MEKVIHVGKDIKSGNDFKKGYVYKHKKTGIMYLCLSVDLECDGLVMMDLDDMLADCYTNEYGYDEFECQGKMTEIKTIK